MVEVQLRDLIQRVIEKRSACPGEKHEIIAQAPFEILENYDSFNLTPRPPEEKRETMAGFAYEVLRNVSCDYGPYSAGVVAMMKKQRDKF